MDRPVDCHVERRATRMVEMMHRLDVDTGLLIRLDNGGAVLAARQNCMSCAHVHECLAWLDNKRTACDPCEFCPNAKLFSACAKPTKPDYQI